MKRIPLLPLDRTPEGGTSGLHDVESLISTGSFANPPRPMTALDSTAYSHAKALAEARRTDPFFRTTSSSYGSRYPLEQVGHTATHNMSRDTAACRPHAGLASHASPPSLCCCSLVSASTGRAAQPSLGGTGGRISTEGEWSGQVDSSSCHSTPSSPLSPRDHRSHHISQPQV